MGLSVALSNVLSGMRTGQNAIDVLSRNVANAGTPGYHRRSLSVIDTLGVNSTSARNGTVERAFNHSLQQQHTRTISSSGFASVRANFIDRLQTVIGKPGAAGSLDSSFANFQAALSALAASPDNYAVRTDAVGKAQVLAQTLNDLSTDVQILRREVESKMSTTVSDLNLKLSTLETLNGRLTDTSMDPTSRAELFDQRDRLIADVAVLVDIRAEYHQDGTVSLMTRTGVGLLDASASVFEFRSAGAISAMSQFDFDSAKNGVGSLLLKTPAGFVLDLVQQNVIRGGELGGLIELRDTTLVRAQDQLDDIAAGLAQSMSTIETEGAPITVGPASGFEVDIASIRNGNDLVLDYTVNGVAHSIRVVRVDDPTRLPMDVIDANGHRVIGLDFSGGAASVAAQLQTALGPGLAVSNPAGSTIRILDDGAAGTTNVMGLSARSTVTATQGAGLALSLFVDHGNADFTNYLDGFGQKRGFASRITVNEAILNNMQLMVQFEAGGSLGDDDRADYLLDRLDNMRFATYDARGRPAAYRLSGTINDLITQAINFQGNVAAAALGDDETQKLILDTVNARLDAEYGVDIDEEMARLMELQNAYAANARVLSAIQDLLDQLLRI
jgi:flagellar hook-associated protein 1